MEIKNSNLVYSNLLYFIRKKEPCVLATITLTHGSTPQKSGSSAVFGEQKILAGTIGGGVTELQIEKLASEKIKSKKSGYFQFNLNNEITVPDAAICGGNMSVLVDAVPEKSLSVFETLINCISNRIPGILITICTHCKPDVSNISRYWLTEKNSKIISDGIDSVVLNAADKMLSEQNHINYQEIEFTTAEEEKIAFLERIEPLPQLIIAGAGHVGKALSHLGKLLDFEVIVWDDRPEYANSEIFSDADKILAGSLEECFKNFHPQKDSYIVIATRGHKNDTDVLRHFMHSAAGYIGMIGSRNKIDQIHKSSVKEGWGTEKEWNKIHAPVGLKIGSKTVQEIAVSIAAQLIQARDQNKK